MDFIKSESDRSIEKLLKNANINYKYKERLSSKKFYKINSLENNRKNISELENKIDIKNTQKINFINENNSKLMRKDIKILDEIKLVFLKKIGIENISNSCFINSSIQVLIHIPLFIDKFIESLKRLEFSINSISYNLYLICQDMINENKNQALNISKFLYIFGLKHNNFNGFFQNDSLEFLRLLLADINDELNENKNNYVYEEFDYEKKLSKIEKEKEFHTFFNQREKSIITELFYSQLITTITCPCGYISYTFMKILDIPLLLNSNNISTDINELLDNYFSNVLSFEYKCESFKKFRMLLKGC